MPRDYMDWKEQFGLLVPYQHKKRLNGTVSVHVDFIYKRPKKPTSEVPVGDLDNLEKSCFDALQDCGVIDNDRCIVRSSSAKGYGSADAVRVVIEPCAAVVYP